MALPFAQTHTAVRFSERLTNAVATGLWPVHLSCGFCKANGPQGRGYKWINSPATRLLRNPVNGLVADAALNLFANRFRVFPARAGSDSLKKSRSTDFERR